MDRFINLSEDFKKRLVTELPETTSIRGAGVIILDSTGEKLLLVLGKRHNKWSFPKGSKEPKETIKECALRELREETGIKNTDIQLKDQYFIDRKYLYFIGYLINDEVKTKIFDKREIKQVSWKKIKNISSQDYRNKCNASLKAILPKQM